MSVLPLCRVGEREEVAEFARHVPNLAQTTTRAMPEQKVGMKPPSKLLPYPSYPSPQPRRKATT